MKDVVPTIVFISFFVLFAYLLFRSFTKDNRESFKVPINFKKTKKILYRLQCKSVFSILSISKNRSDTGSTVSCLYYKIMLSH